MLNTRPYSKNTKAKRAGGMAQQAQGPEFKPHYCKNKTKLLECMLIWPFSRY
jgi:hypothetical protein